MKIMGRHIRLGWIYISPFNGYVHISNLKIYENNSDSLFFSARGVTANFYMLKMLKKTYEIENISLDRPWGKIIQNRKELNFDDLIVRWSPKDTIKKSKEPVHFNILQIVIRNGEFHYEDKATPVNYFIKNVNIESPGKWWDADSMQFKFSFLSGPTPGEVHGTYEMDFDSLEYRFALQVQKFDLEILNQYLQGLVNYARFNAILDAEVKAKGNFGRNIAFSATGPVSISNMHFGKMHGEDFASFEKLAVVMTNLAPRELEYDFDTIMLLRPFFTYERYDKLDNLRRMFGENGERYTAAQADPTRFNLIVVIGDFFKDLAENIVKSYYRANKVAIYQGNFGFNDYALREKFSVNAVPFTIVSDTIDKNKKKVQVTLRSAIQPYGEVAVNLSFNPQNYGSFSYNYDLQKVPVALFNPYVVTYTSFPLDRGTIELKGFMDVVDSNINSRNNLIITDPRVAKRVKKDDTKWIPVPLIMSIAREAGEGIDYEIPIRGKLGSPKIKLGQVILDVVRNIFVKPPITPYLFRVEHLEKQVEKFLVLKWEPRQTTLYPFQQKFIEKVAVFLRTTPDAKITASTFEYSGMEKEQILFFEAKKKYFLSGRAGGKTIDETDSLAIDKMSVKDSGFVHFLNKMVPDTLIFTVQEKCRAIVNNKVIEARYAQLINDRKKEFMSFFVQQGVDNRLITGTKESGVPYNGFSYFKIDYNGAFPGELLNAYYKMNELNQEPPRKKFERERKKNGGLFAGKELTGQ